jgi:hypothetical protein
MKLAFVSGPYRAKTKLGIFINILKARKVAKELWKIGYVAVCPHLNSALMDGIIDDSRFLEGDMELLRKCDVVVVCKGWSKSSGTKGEIKEAYRNSIPVLFWTLQDNREWLAWNANDGLNYYIPKGGYYTK